MYNNKLNSFKKNTILLRSNGFQSFYPFLQDFLLDFQILSYLRSVLKKYYFEQLLLNLK